MTIKDIKDWLHDRESRIFIGLLVFMSLWALLISLSYSPSILNERTLARIYNKNDLWLFYRQLFNVLTGLSLFVLMQRLDMARLAKQKWIYLAAAVALCGAPLVHFIGYSVNGASRWVKIANGQYIGSFLIHSGLWASVFFVVFISAFFAKENSQPTKKSLSIILAIYLLMNILLIAQPDMPMSIMLFVLSVITLLFFEYRKTAGVLFLLWMLLLIKAMSVPYRFNRIMMFLNPYEDAQGIGFHLVQSFSAIQQGGLFGSALQGKSNPSVLLPAANTDFVFSFTAEQYGLAGMVIMLTACLSFFYFAVRAGMKARSRFEANLTFLLAAMCMAMNVISMCVSIGMLPTMGMPMPFFSYGGGTVVLGFLAAGMIYRQLRDKEAEQNLLHIQSGKIMMIASGFCIIVLIRAVGVVCQSY